MRRIALLLFVVLLVPACQADVPPTADPAATAGAPTGEPAAPTVPVPTNPNGPTADPQRPIATLDPNATPPVAIRPALPEPELDDPTLVGEAIASPTRRLQGVVSMLAGLGIGIYRADGSPIRAGDERQLGDPWLYEDEVHALVTMAAAESRTDLIRFTDWHAGLRELGLEMSANELLDAYVETYLYDWDNETFFVKMILAQGLDLVEEAPSETYLTRLQAWLLLLDGFVVGGDDPVAGAWGLRHAGPAFIGSNHEEKWGGASAAVRKPLTGGERGVDWFEAAQRLETLARAVPFTISPTSQRAHEGHRREGDPVSYDVWFAPHDVSGRMTPFGDDFFLLPLPDPDGLTVSWQASPAQTLNDHGTLHDTAGRADPLAAGTRTVGGRTGVTFVPKREEADEQGELAEDAVVLNATAPLHEIARRTWALPRELLGYLERGGGTASATSGEQPGATLEIEWHGLRGLKIKMVDEYDISIDFPKVRGAEMSIGEVKRVGTDTFEGFLALREDGTWRGTMRGTTRAEYYQRAFDESCSWSISAEQDLIVVAEETGYSRPEDPGPVGIVLRFYPGGPPEMGEVRCDYELPYHYGSDPYEDPSVDPREAIPSGAYAPFNDLRINAEGGFPTGYQPGSEATGIYREHAPGMGGGTWTVTIEDIDHSLR